MLRQFSFSIAVALSLVSAATAASPFAGKWKFNTAKSKLSGPSDSVAAAGPNTWKFISGTFSYTLKADGTFQPDAFGETVALRILSPAKWERTTKVNGKLDHTSTWELSADGKTMTRTGSGKHEDGTSYTSSSTLKRTAGTKGFEGTWESTDVKPTFVEAVIEDNGATGITLLIPADNIKSPLTFDGKESTQTGPRIPPGTTNIVTKVVSPNKLEVTGKFNGKVTDTETWEISADGKTFTYTELDAGETKPIVIVSDKQ